MLKFACGNNICFILLISVLALLGFLIISMVFIFISFYELKQCITCCVSKLIACHDLVIY